MSQVRMIVRDAVREICGTPHGSDAERIVAALSAEPETIAELEPALERFMAVSEGGYFRFFRDAVDDEPYDAGIVIVDLAARMVLYQSTYSDLSHSGYVGYHDGRCCTDQTIRYHLPPDWKFDSDIDGWRWRCEERRKERAANPPLDARAVLYGRPLVEFIARECLEMFRDRPLPPPEDGKWKPYAEMTDEEKAACDQRNAEHDLIKESHVRWLMNARDDLRGKTPREVLFEKHRFIQWDEQDRCEQWSRQLRAPRPLDENSHAYRYAGFGTHEIVKYYDLVRHLYWSCRERVEELRRQGKLALMMAGDFLVDEVPRLEQERETWLDSSDEDFHGRTPRTIIASERRRMPTAVSGHEAMADPDCPCCQMLADMPGPTFWHLDGSNMDDDFAFSFDETREEWEQDRRRWEEFSRKFDAKREEEKRLGVEAPGGGYSDPDYAWQRSFVAREEDEGKLPLEVRLFSIGAALCEVTVALKDPPEERGLIDALSRDFGNLREIARSGEAAQIEALLEPVIDRFCQTLDEAAGIRESASEGCDTVKQRLRRFLEPPSLKDPAVGPFDDTDPFGDGKPFDPNDIPF